MSRSRLFVWTMRKKMSQFEVLEVFLYDRPIGFITNLSGDKNLFSLNQKYIDQKDRPTLSLSLRDIDGNLITDIKSTRVRLPPFFSNLLPEGAMRKYLASQANVSDIREFYLLQALGDDLPGALKVIGSNRPKPFNPKPLLRKNKILHFSLAGVQFKFSVFQGKDGRIELPNEGVGGNWILKLPHMEYSGVPENEYTMMEMARLIGIDVPETALVSMDQIQGLPDEMSKLSNHAFIIKRFDRTEKGEGIHIEDFAQVFGVFPERKYDSASYRNIAQVIQSGLGEQGVIEFIRRFIFNVLIGNGDMHLKNWSVIYLDKVNPSLAPAYDFVSTIPYIPSESLALTFVDSKAFSSINEDQLKRFAAKAAISEKIVLETARETVQSFKEHWQSVHKYPVDKAIIKLIDEHLKKIPLYG